MTHCLQMPRQQQAVSRTKPKESYKRHKYCITCDDKPHVYLLCCTKSGVRVGTLLTSPANDDRYWPVQDVAMAYPLILVALLLMKCRGFRHNGQL